MNTPTSSILSIAFQEEKVAETQEQCNAELGRMQDLRDYERAVK